MGRKKKEDTVENENCEDLSNIKPDDVWFSLGLDVIDLTVGGGMGLGTRAGKTICVRGWSQSGKTFIAQEMIARNKFEYKEKFHFCFDDCENGNTFDTKTLYGFDSEPHTNHSETIQDLYCNVRTFSENIPKGHCGIYVVDSLDGLSSDEIIKINDARMLAFKKGKDLDKGSYAMEIPKFLSQFFFKDIPKVLKKNNVLLVFIQQLRDNIDPFSFIKEKSSGGKGIEYYANLIINLKRVSYIEKADLVVGSVVRVKTAKLKASRPIRECIYSLYFTYGLDNIGSNLDFFFGLRSDSGNILKEANEIKWIDGNTYKRKDLVDRIDSSPEEQLELTKMVITAWEERETKALIARRPKYEYA
jgi:hypothetical protein